MEILFGKHNGRYKANLHCHTTLSDGKATPDRVKEEYKKRGYSVIAFTDHEHLIDHSDMNDEDFLTITSAELSIKEIENQSTLANKTMKVTHLNIYALAPDNATTPCYSSKYDHYTKNVGEGVIKFDGEYKRIYSAEGINAIIKEAHEKGFLVAYNHPSWSLENANDYLQYEGLDFVEIYNCGCVKAGYTDDEAAFSDILRSGVDIFCTAADDNHNARGFDEPYTDSFGGWVVIDAPTLEYSAIMSALKKGDFYASSGPEILSLTREDYTVRIKTSPAKKINLIPKGRGCKKTLAEEGGYICEAEFDITGLDEYFRLKVTDENGKCAYTQAFKI